MRIFLASGAISVTIECIWSMSSDWYSHAKEYVLISELGLKPVKLLLERLVIFAFLLSSSKSLFIVSSRSTEA